MDADLLDSTGRTQNGASLVGVFGDTGLLLATSPRSQPHPRERLVERNSTVETVKFLADTTPNDFQDKAMWQRLPTIVRVRPDGEVFPVRAKYDGDADSTIALNHLRSEEPLWFTLADCVAAKLLSGKTPIVEEAISFAPDGIQSGLTPN